MKLLELILVLIKIPTDFILGILAYYSAYALRSNPNFIPWLQLPPDPTIFPSLNTYNTFSLIAVTILIILLILNKSYSLKNPKKLTEEIWQIMILTTSLFMLIITYFFIIRELPFSRLTIGYTWIISIIYISTGRILLKIIEKSALKKGIGKKNIIFIGDNQITEKILKKYKKNLKYNIIKIIKTNKIQNIEQELNKIIENQQIHEIIQTEENLTNQSTQKLITYCRSHHIQYNFVPTILSLHQKNINVETINAIPIIKLNPTTIDGWGRITKRIFDVSIATIGIIILSPLLLLTIILIKLDSKGTILFQYLDDGTKVKRVGQYGKLFNFYKFRSMYPNTHNLRYTKLAKQNLRKGSPLVKIKNDPRITKVGKILRKTNIDELPQLFNVLKGEMSIVGPRPHLPEEVEKYKKEDKFVLTIKPGITGLAQVAGRSELDFNEEIKLDTYYIENWSIWLDIKTIIKTIGVLFKGYEE